MRDYLKELRVKTGISQTDVAKKLGVAQSYYNMIESGQRMKDMSLSMMERLADIFHVSVLFIAEKEKAPKGANS